VGHSSAEFHASEWGSGKLLKPWDDNVWWLTFRHGDVVIVAASSLIHARTVAAQYGLGRPGHFAEGHFIDPERAALIRDDDIGRVLTPTEARTVREALKSLRILQR
jgi:hypothetical protein